MMFKIKSGKLYGSNYSFALPERFNLIADVNGFSEDDLIFGSIVNDYLHIVIYFKKESHSAKSDMQEMFDKYETLIKLSDFVSIKRGKGVGVGIYYENTFGATQHYGERYNFKKNEDGVTQIFFDISLWSGRSKSRLTIQEGLKFPTVKAFLESIEYF